MAGKAKPRKHKRIESHSHVEYCAFVNRIPSQYWETYKQLKKQTRSFAHLKAILISKGIVK